MKLPYVLGTATAGLLLCAAVSAQSPPSAGSLNQEIERERAERAPETAPSLHIEQRTHKSTPSADQQEILVTNLRVTGAQIYSEAELVALAGFAAERELTLSELRAMAGKIADHYHSNGYPLTQAYLPAQEIRNGEVSIAVLEGEYGEVSLRNQSKVGDGVVDRILAGLQNGDTIAIAPLESRLLLLSDIPGVNVRSTLVPGASVGSADLIVDVEPGERFSGNLTADSLGNRYTGEHRLGGTLNMNNPSGRGDLLSVRALTSDAGLHYGRAAYQLPFGRLSTGVAWSHMQYRLGKEFDALDASGTATIASLYGSYAVLRSRQHNIYVQLNLDDKYFRDEADATSTVLRKKARVAMLSLNGDVRDEFGGGGWNAYSLTWSSGELDIRSPEALAADAATVRSDGHYDKFAFSAARLQHVSERLSLYATVKGQLASQNLDTSEKIGLGGMSDVSAYPSGEAYGDEGYVLKVEARTPLQRLSRHVPGQLQLVGFADTGRVTLNKNAWAEGDNHRTLHSLGIGLNWTQYDDFAVSATFAHRLGGEEATSAPDEKSRFWLQAVKYF